METTGTIVVCSASNIVAFIFTLKSLPMQKSNAVIKQLNRKAIIAKVENLGIEASKCAQDCACCSAMHACVHK